MTKLVGFLFSGMCVSAFYHGRLGFALGYLALSLSMFALSDRENRR